jgi:hypothetical protein
MSPALSRRLHAGFVIVLGAGGKQIIDPAAAGPMRKDGGEGTPFQTGDFSLITPQVDDVWQLLARNVTHLLCSFNRVVDGRRAKTFGEGLESIAVPGCTLPWTPPRVTIRCLFSMGRMIAPPRWWEGGPDARDLSKEMGLLP